MWSLFGKGQPKFVKLKMAATPIYGKNLLQNPKADDLDLETWHTASGNQDIFINDDPELTMTYFVARANLVGYVFGWGKLLHSH